MSSCAACVKVEVRVAARRVFGHKESTQDFLCLSCLGECVRVHMSARGGGEIQALKRPFFLPMMT